MRAVVPATVLIRMPFWRVAHCARDVWRRCRVESAPEGSSDLDWCIVREFADDADRWNCVGFGLEKGRTSRSWGIES